MKLHRFYIHDLHTKYGPVELGSRVWVNDPELCNQWSRVLRYKVGDQLVAFDGMGNDRIYKIHTIKENDIGLELVTEQAPQIPQRKLYLFFSMLKKDKNEWVLQKCTELGVSHFVPLITDRTEKLGFDQDRALKIVVEASEQCGRSDIPRVREPIGLQSALDECRDKMQIFYAEQSDDQTIDWQNESGEVFVGPEGGWTDTEKVLLAAYATKLGLAQFTLRAETACVAASTLLMR